MCSLRSPRALARSRSLALRSSPRLCSARFARCTLATSPAARFVCLACRLALLAASPAALASLVLRLLPRTCPLLCARHAFSSLSLASSPAARCARLACCSLLTAAPAPLTASPAALASLAALPAAARFARRFSCGCSLRSPSNLLARLTRLSASPSSISRGHTEKSARVTDSPPPSQTGIGTSFFLLILFFSRYPTGELPEGEDCVFRRPPVVIKSDRACEKTVRSTDD